MNNLLISANMVAGLFAEPSVAELYRTERTIPNTITFFKRAVRMAQTTNPSTLSLLGRVLKVTYLALGYLQILRPPHTTQATLAIAALKSACSSAAYLMLTYAKNPQTAGVVEISINEIAMQSLIRLEKYDPLHQHLVPVATNEGNRVHVEGDGVSLDDIRQGFHLVGLTEITLPTGIVMREDLLSDLEVLLTGIRFPVGVL